MCSFAPRRLIICGLLILGMALAGCAGLKAQQQARQTKSTVDLLLASGFKQVFPPNQRAADLLKAMPQRQILIGHKGPKVFYVYPDYAGCGCLYAGTPEQYQAYRNLALQARLAAEELAAARLEESMNLGWDEWGEAGPWWSW